MHRSLSVFLSTGIFFAAIATLPQQASASDGFGAGLFGGLVAGSILGAAASGPRDYEPAPVYVEPAPMYDAPACYWQRGEPVWDGRRGMWVRPRFKVCE
jgi:hypothetical protein